MPLVHAENGVLQARAVSLAERMAMDATSDARGAWTMGCERTRHLSSTNEAETTPRVGRPD
jgi:hypothetical protein